VTTLEHVIELQAEAPGKSTGPGTPVQPLSIDIFFGILRFCQSILTRLSDEIQIFHTPHTRLPQVSSSH
jgi:hypothetical protein